MLANSHTEVMSSSTAQAPPPHHGVKRKALDSLDDDQRFAKRFDLLNLGTSLLPIYAFHRTHR